MSMDDLSPVLTTVAPNEGTDTPAAETPAQTEAEALKSQSLAGRHELATQMVAKLCHDFISPAGAIRTARLIVCSRPRTLPARDQGWQVSARSAASVMPRGSSRPNRARAASRNPRASAGTSSGRASSDGSVTVTSRSLQ